MPAKRIITARNRALVLSSVVALYVFTTIFFLLQINQYTQDIYEYPYTVSSQARIMKSRLYDFRSVLPVLFSSKNLTPQEIERTLKAQEQLQLHSLDLIRERYRGDPRELEHLKEVLEEIGTKRLELRDFVKIDPTPISILNGYNQIVEPAFTKLDNTLNLIAEQADKRGKEIHDQADQIIVYIVWFTLIMGVFLILFIYRETNAFVQSNQKILQRDKLLNLLCANVNDVYVIVDSKGNPEFVSENIRKILDLEPDQIQKDKTLLLNLFHQEERDWLKQTIADLDSPKFAPRGIKLQGRDQSYKLHVYRMKAADATWFVISLVDETEQMEYQRNLGDALKAAKKASEAKSQFLSHMSHEIRTPMNAIIGMTTIALAKLDNKDKVKDCLNKTIQASRHLLGLINDILDMSRIESQKLVLSQEPFNFKEFLKNLSDLIEAQAKAKGVHFSVILNGVQQEKLVGDALRTNQILINVLSNAVKFTPEGGSVVLKVTERMTGSSELHLSFTVTDTGIGMTEEHLKRVFLPFEQASAEIGKRFGGSGLGLAITHNLVSLMGGSISAESEPGKGSTFIVDLPFGVTADAKHPAAKLKELKVLVVDNDLDTCEHACLLLSQLGQNCQFALNGEKAVEAAKQSVLEGTPFEVCFVDWKMPGMDGEETAKALRDVLGDQVLIFVISAYDWSPIERHARAIGVNGFIAKPFFTSSFYDCLISGNGLKTSNTSSSCAKNAENSTSSEKKKIILVVEDNAFNAEVAGDFLEMAGFEAEFAEDGEQALQIFENAPSGYFDLIFMDIQMPNMDGLTAARRIRALAREDARRIPIIAMTANAFSEDIAHSLEAGMNDHISKPLEIKKLNVVLAKYLKRATG